MKINIFFFISNFNFGGAGNAVLNFLKKLNKNKFNVNIIFLGKSDYLNHIPKNIKIYQINSNFFFFKTLFCFFKIRKILKKEVLINKKNVFISNIHYSNILSIIFLRKISYLKIFLFERTSLKELDIYFSFLSFIKNKLIKLLIKLLYKKADEVFSNSITVQNELKNLSINAKIIYSGSLKKILPKKKFKKKYFFKIISVGRLTRQKNYKMLIDSIKITKKENFKLFIYGSGKLYNNLRQYIVKNDLSSKIKLMSHIKNKNKIYKNADLLIHTALFEGLPNSIVDAMNYNVPVIAYNGAGGISEILGHGRFGKIIMKNSKYEISRNIDQFLLKPKNLQNKILRSKKILKRFKDIKTANVLEKEILKIYKI